jgi:hypothetical protein
MLINFLSSQECSIHAQETCVFDIRLMLLFWSAVTAFGAVWVSFHIVRVVRDGVIVGGAGTWRRKEQPAKYFSIIAFFAACVVLLAVSAMMLFIGLREALALRPLL